MEISTKSKTPNTHKQGLEQPNHAKKALAMVIAFTTGGGVAVAVPTAIPIPTINDGVKVERKVNASYTITPKKENTRRSGEYPKVDNANEKWEEYLKQLMDPTNQEGLSEVQGLIVSQVWNDLKEANLAPPVAEFFQDEFHETPFFQMLWKKGIHHLEVETLASGEFNWFYMNLESQETLDEELVRELGPHWPLAVSKMTQS